MSAKLNFEFKARTNELTALEEKLLSLQPVFKGTDIQTDTYFNVPEGRLKLREGNIENALIHYIRPDLAGAKQSDILLYKHQPDATLKAILVKTLGVKVVVKKSRKIYFVDNVKFHFDTLDNLGSFVEVEAIADDTHATLEAIQQQANYYRDFLGIREEDFIAVSYSDLVLGN
jgi:adenylate cyclase class 2